MVVDQRWAEIEHGEGTCPYGRPKAETGYVEGRMADLELESQLSVDRQRALASVWRTVWTFESVKSPLAAPLDRSSCVSSDIGTASSAVGTHAVDRPHAVPTRNRSAYADRLRSV